jgi:uncharacterized ion transporter superfamily protein YfcC
MQPAAPLQAMMQRRTSGKFALVWMIFVVLLAGWSADVVTGDFFGGGLHLLVLGAIVPPFLETFSRGQRAQH